MSQHLDENQLLILNHLKEITAKDDDELLPILMGNNFDLEISVNHFMITNNTEEENNTVRNRNTSIHETAALQVDTDNVPHSNVYQIQPANNSNQGFFMKAWTFLSSFTPINFFAWYLYASLRDIFHFVGALFGIQFQQQPQLEAHVEIDNFISSLTRKFLSPDSPSFTESYTLPPMERQSYGAVLTQIKRDLKFLLVYLHGGDHCDTELFVTNVLLHPAFSEFLNNHRHEIVFWGCNIDSYEGGKVSQALREHTYPFLGLVCLQQRNISPSNPFEVSYSTQRLSLVGRIEGYNKARFHRVTDTSPVDFYIDLITNLMRNNEATLIAARADKAEREASQRIRREQDLEFNETLLRDRQIKAEEEAQALAEKEAKEEAEHCESVWDTLKEHLRCSVPPEPDTLIDNNLIQLRIRLPNGQSLDRLFSMQDSTKLLHLLILSLADSPRNFEIVKAFPKGVITCTFPGLELPLDTRSVFVAGLCEPGRDLSFLWASSGDESDPPTFEALGFGKKEMVMVVDLDA